MSNRKNKSAEVVSFRDVALAFDAIAVDAMVVAINESLERRDTFESSQGLNLASENSYTRERARIVKNQIAVARLFLALNVEPSAVIERKVTESAMFNAKALKKIVEIAQFACGNSQKLERVTRAFIASCMIASDRGVGIVTNRINQRFLSSADMSKVLTDEELAKTLSEYQHAAMSGGAPTQSSQSRNVLDVLRLGRIESVEKSRDAISIDANHSFFAYFRATFMQ